MAVLLFGLAACGGGDGEETSDTTDGQGSAAESAVDADGTLRIAYDLVGASRGGFNWDPSIGLTTIGDLSLYQWVYGGLMRKDPSGALVPDLAERARVVDANTIEVVVREGVIMPDGSALDADGVKAALERTLAKKGTLAFAENFFKLSAIDVTSPMAIRLTIPDGSAPSWFDTYMAGLETLIVPADVDFSKPSGAGPFRVTAFAPQDSATLERNPEYWDAESIKVARVELVNAPDAQASLAAVNAGQADFGRIEFAQVDGVRGDNKILSAPNPNGIVHFPICKDDEPFDDAKVRKALNLAIDREVINDALYGGLGTVAWDLWPEGHQFHNPNLTEVYAHDPERAQKLLAEAGHADGFTFDLLVLNGAGMPELAAVVQQQLAEVGVTMNIVISANYVEDRNNRKAPVGLVPTLSPDIGKFLQWSGDTAGNMCRYKDPEIDAKVAELGKLSAASDEAVELWHELQDKIIREDALSILVMFQSTMAAYDSRAIGGVELGVEPILLPEIRKVFVKK